MQKTPTAPASVTAPTPPTAAAGKRKPRNPAAAADRAERKAVRQPLRNGEVLGLDGEVLSRSRSTGFHNDFEVPLHLIPPGFVPQWVRTSCHGKPDPANVNAHHAQGWRPWQTPEILAHYHVKSGHVERDGQMLCIRPKKLNDDALAEERASAYELKQAQAEQFGVRKLPLGFEEGGISGDGRYDARRKIRRTVEGSPTDLLPQRQLAVGDDD
jgi:hypothetical protein